MSKKHGPPKKYDYTDSDLKTALENGIDKKSFIARLARGFTKEEAKVVPAGMHIKTYYRINPDKAPVEPEELEQNEAPKLVLVDKPAPWYLYQYYGMFGKW